MIAIPVGDDLRKQSYRQLVYRAYLLSKPELAVMSTERRRVLEEINRRKADPTFSLRLYAEATRVLPSWLSGKLLARLGHVWWKRHQMSLVDWYLGASDECVARDVGLASVIVMTALAVTILLMR